MKNFIMSILTTLFAVVLVIIYPHAGTKELLMFAIIILVASVNRGEISELSSKLEKNDNRFMKSKSKEKNTCKTCRFNCETHCNVGTHLAEQGKTDICYEGELWEEKR